MLRTPELTLGGQDVLCDRKFQLEAMCRIWIPDQRTLRPGDKLFPLMNDNLRNSFKGLEGLVRDTDKFLLLRQEPSVKLKPDSECPVMTKITSIVMKISYW